MTSQSTLYDTAFTLYEETPEINKKNAKEKIKNVFNFIEKTIPLCYNKSITYFTLFFILLQTKLFIIFLSLQGDFMVYITGDMHGEAKRFNDKQLKRLGKDDTLIVCGDFGFIWNGSEQENRILGEIGEKPYRTLFVDGTHENFDLLEKYPIEEIFGGKVHHISGNLFHMIRGEIYTIDNETYFAFGGGDSLDREMRISSGTWYSHEMPSIEEITYAVENLNKYNYCIDYVITHEPLGNARGLIGSRTEISAISSFFDELAKNVKYKRWYFGCIHLDRKISSKNQAVFTEVLPVHSIVRKKSLFRKSN